MNALVDLQLPENIEIIQVIGNSMLQWRTDVKSGSRLTVLRRHFVDDKTAINVHFQFPVKRSDDILMQMPLPGKSTPITGAVGIQGLAGLNIQVADLKSAEQLKLRDYPRDLSQLTTSPIIIH